MSLAHQHRVNSELAAIHRREDPQLGVTITADPGVRPGTAGLLIDIECSGVRDSSWMYLTSFVTTRIGMELAAVQKKLPDYVVVGFQLYSVRTFHVTLSPRIYKGGQGPLETHEHLRQYKPPHMT